MTKSYLGSSHLTTTGLSTEDTTEYWPFPGGTVQDTVEENVQLVFRSSGVINNLFLRIVLNTVNDTTVITSRKNGSDGNLSVSIPAGTTGDFEDTINSDTIVSGDLYCLESAPGLGSTGQFRLRHQSAVFEADNVGENTVTKFGCTGSIEFAGGNTFDWFSIGGRMATNVRPNTSQVSLQRSGTFKNFGLYVSANTKISDCTGAFYVNLEATEIAVTVPAGITGWFEDLVHTINTHASDEVNFAFESQVTGSLTLNSLTIEYETLDRTGICYVSSILASQVGNGTTFASPLNGVFTLSGENNVMTIARFDCIIDTLTVESDVNQLSVSNTWALRADETDTALLISIPPMATGIFMDIDNVTVTTGQKFNTLTVFADQGDDSVCSFRSIHFYLKEIISSPSSDHNRQFFGVGTDGDNKWVGWSGDGDGYTGTGAVTSTIMNDDYVIHVAEEAPSAGSTATKARASFFGNDGDGFTVSWDVLDTSNAYEIMYVALG